MFKSNSLTIFLTPLILILITSCNSETSNNSSENSEGPLIENDTIVIRDTVFVSEVQELDTLEEINEVLQSYCSLTRMNVLYKGASNPLKISVPGVSSDEIVVAISNGTISRSSGENYIVTVKSGNMARVSVSVMNEEGMLQLINEHEFRVKSVPNPTAYFAGKGVRDNRVKKNELTAAQGVSARMENFDFDLKFNVTSFKLTMIVGGTPIEKVSRSNRLTGDMKVLLKKAKPGSKVYIESIQARGPDGTVRELGCLALKVI